MLEPNTRIELDAVVPNGQSVTLSLGRGREALSINAHDDAYSWNYTASNGDRPIIRAYPGGSRPQEKYRYWWERNDYTPNGRYARAFAMPEAVADASEAMLAERWQPASKRTLRLAVELSDGWLSFWVDDILIHALPATADVAGLELAATKSKDATVGEQRVVAVAPAPGYWRVPLGRVATRPGNPLGEDGGLRAPRTPSLAELSSAISTGAAQASSAISTDIPFLAATNSVDVGRSWTREASVRDGGSPNRGSFGGRWVGALSVAPCRLQFRVPNRRWEAMYLLASCTNANFLTVQFYRPGSGFPIDCVPAEPIATDGKLQVVRVPLRQDQLATFADREVVEFELTGHVENYRGHPEPLNYSRHGMGLPSGVAVHAITLKERSLEIDFDPEEFANVWVGQPSAPAYVLTLRNRDAAEAKAEIKVETRSHDGTDATSQTRLLAVPGKGETKIRLATPVSKFGWHSVTLTVNGERYERTMVVLRRREHPRRAFEDPGFFFGGWSPVAGLHFTPPTYDSMRLASKLGLSSFSHGNAVQLSEVATLAKDAGIRDYTCFNGMATGFNTGRLKNYDETFLEERMRGAANRESDICDPSFQICFAEPGGIGPECSIVGLCGGEVPPRSDAERDRYLNYKTNFLHFASAFRKVCPDKKILLPWGSPLFTAAYIRDPDTRDQIDGMGFDTAFFDRLPEGQLHSCSLYVVTLLNREWAKYRKDKPLYVTMEGPCISREAPESLTPDEHLRNVLRASLILMANGVRHLFASVSYGAECASYWGEQHYGGGALSRITLNPHRLYAAEGTLVRLLRDCEFVRTVPTGSLGTFCLEFRNVKDGTPLHVLWCICGKVPFTVKGGKVQDAMDNPTECRFASPEPLFVLGCKGGIAFGKQVFDEADTTPAADAVKLCDLSGWTQSTNAPEVEYLNNMPGNICRYPVEMKVAREGDRLSVCLPEGLPDRDAMPFCTTLVPPKPVTLPGRPKTIALDVETDADWGRVVYVLRDAKGEKFISVGRVNTYNVDDTKCDSFFTFEGRRLVRFELPGNRPWDKSRYAGSCWWGAYGGDDCVDYPLSLEKIFIERRTKAMYVNDVAEIKPKPVLLGSLYVEGIEPDSDLVMPPPPKGAPRQNPIAAIEGTLEPTEITGVTHPTHQYDGTRGHFAFKEMPDAKEYDIYVSLSPTGEGAILLKQGAKGSGELVNGFLADTDNYAFVVWRDAKGAVSKPSAPFKFRLKDEFAEK